MKASLWNKKLTGAGQVLQLFPASGNPQLIKAIPTAFAKIITSRLLLMQQCFPPHRQEPESETRILAGTLLDFTPLAPARNQPRCRSGAMQL